MSELDAKAIEVEVTGEDAMTDTEYEMGSRGVVKGYANSRTAYLVGVRDGIEATIDAFSKMLETKDG